MDTDWSRIGKDYLFEMSLKDNSNRQVTLLQSWKKIVAIVLQDTKHIIITKKHYSYNVTTSLEKLSKQQKLTVLYMSPTEFYKLLTQKFEVDRFFKNCEDDIEYVEPPDYDIDESYEDEQDDDYEETDDSDDGDDTMPF